MNINKKKQTHVSKQNDKKKCSLSPPYSHRSVHMHYTYINGPIILWGLSRIYEYKSILRDFSEKHITNMMWLMCVCHVHWLLLINKTQLDFMRYIFFRFHSSMRLKLMFLVLWFWENVFSSWPLIWVNQSHCIFTKMDSNQKNVGICCLTVQRQLFFVSNKIQW